MCIVLDMAPVKRIQRHDILAWLGDDHGLTTDQIDDLTTTAEDIANRYPNPDDTDDREAALVVAYRLTTGDTNVITELAAELLAADIARHRAVVGLRQAAISTIEGDHTQTQAGFATLVGVTRMTVRNWLGL